MSKNILFEQKTENRILQGVIDCIDCKNKIVYEFKCVQELQDEHYIQLACYAFLYNRQDYKYVLFNIRTGELNEIIFEQKQLEKMVGFLYDIKCTEKKEISDEEFLKQNVPPPPQL